MPKRIIRIRIKKIKLKKRDLKIGLALPLIIITVILGSLAYYNLTLPKPEDVLNQAVSNLMNYQTYYKKSNLTIGISIQDYTSNTTLETLTYYDYGNLTSVIQMMVGESLVNVTTKIINGNMTTCYDNGTFRNCTAQNMTEFLPSPSTDELASLQRILESNNSITYLGSQIIVGRTCDNIGIRLNISELMGGSDMLEASTGLSLSNYNEVGMTYCLDRETGISLDMNMIMRGTVYLQPVIFTMRMLTTELEFSVPQGIFD